MVAVLWLFLLLLPSSASFASALFPPPASHDISAGGISMAATARHRVQTGELAGYKPLTDVSNYAILDRDLDSMTLLLEQGDLDRAKEVYEHGMYSTVIANLSLLEPAPATIPAFGTDDSTASGRTTLLGSTRHNGIVKGWLARSLQLGDTTLLFQYIQNDPDVTDFCIPKAIPEASTEGCLNVTGSLILLQQHGLVLNYSSYVEQRDTSNGASLRHLSISKANEEPATQDDTSSDQVLAMFENYYGTKDYADRWVTAAFDQLSTQFYRGNLNFETVSPPVQTELISNAILYMHVWMHVVDRMERAVHRCECENGMVPPEDCAVEEETNKMSLQPPSSSLHLWDQAVACYVGSLMHGSNEGLFLYAAAERYCAQFNTCDNPIEDSLGRAEANVNILEEFQQGQSTLRKGGCDAAGMAKDRIRTLMTIPLIQGTLAQAYVQENTSQETKNNGGGTSVAAAILPIVNKCDQDDAKIIHDNIMMGQAFSFDAVKSALERNYDCMNISCTDVGGIYDGKQYLVPPCGMENRYSSLALAIGILLPSLLVLWAVLILYRRREKRIREAEWEQFNRQLPGWSDYFNPRGAFS